MFRIKICVMLIVLLIGCVGRPIPQQSGMSSQIRSESGAPAQSETDNSFSRQSLSLHRVIFEKADASQ